MQVWLICFVLLFGAAEMFEWMQELSLPMPIFILGGIFLAIASNYSKLSNLPFHPDYEEPESLPDVEQPTTQKTTTQGIRQEAARKKISPTQQQPMSPINRSSKPAISFEIRKPFNPGD